MNPKYKTFPLILFLRMQEDESLKTVFRNWELLSKVYFFSVNECAIVILMYL